MTDHLSARAATAPAAAPARPTAAAMGGRRRIHGGWVAMVVAGLVAAVANVALLTDRGPSATVVVIEGNIPPGTPVEALAFHTAELGIDDPGAMNLVTPEQLSGGLTGLVTAGRLGDGSVLRADDLRIPPDDVPAAMSIPVERARAVGGAVVVGDVVDVIAEVDDEVVVVVDGAAVLDVVVPDTGLGASGTGHALTLAVTDEEALALSAALRTGPLDVIRTDGG